MPNETVAPLPLSGREVKTALLFKVEDELEKSGHLHDDNAYSSFKAEITIKLTLADYGREVRDNHIVTESADTGLVPPVEGVPVEMNSVMEPAPPNQVRVDTNQAVPVTTVVEGKVQTRRVKYAVRKTPKP